MHAVVPIVQLVGQLLTENCEHENRKRAGVPFVGMLAKRKHGYGSIMTGELERRNPLPPGRYWIDVIGNVVTSDKVAEFDQWLTAQGDDITLENRQHFPTVMPIPFVQQFQPPHDWFLFRVNRPVSWVSEEFGWPTIAGPNVHNSEDTSTAKESMATVDERTEEQWAWVKWTAIAVVGIGGIIAITMLVRR